MSVLLGSRAFVFFSSPVPKEFINHIKGDTSVLPRIGALREVGVFILFLKASAIYDIYRQSFFPSSHFAFLDLLQMNLEYFPIDSQVLDDNIRGFKMHNECMICNFIVIFIRQICGLTV